MEIEERERHNFGAELDFFQLQERDDVRVRVYKSGFTFSIVHKSFVDRFSWRRLDANEFFYTDCSFLIRGDNRQLIVFRFITVTTFPSCIPAVC